MNVFLASLYILVGTYTGRGSDGIYVWEFNPETARTTYIGMARVENPSYLTASADGKVIYAVSENEREGAAVNALRFNPRMGELTLVDTELTGAANEQNRSGGAPCNVATNGRLVVTANYVGGEVSVFEIRDDGTLSPMVQRLTLASPTTTLSRKSHMHCVKFSPDGRFLFAADLGTDKLLRWNLAASGGAVDAASLRTFDIDPTDPSSELPKGSGPRHFIFDASGESLYLVNEFAGTVVAFDYNGGDLVRRGLVDADPADGRGSADIVLSKNGRFLYASNRLKNDGVAIFGIGAGGELKAAGYKTTGVHPRNLSLSPDGRFMLVSCKNSDAVQVFAVDETTGALTPTQFALDISQPTCVLFVERTEL